MLNEQVPLPVAKNCKWLCKVLWSACLPAIVSGALSNLIQLEPCLSYSCFKYAACKWALLQSRWKRVNVDVCRLKCRDECTSRPTISMHKHDCRLYTCDVWSTLTEQAVQDAMFSSLVTVLFLELLWLFSPVRIECALPWARLIYSNQSTI